MSAILTNIQLQSILRLEDLFAGNDRGEVSPGCREGTNGQMVLVINLIVLNLIIAAYVMIKSADKQVKAST